MSTDQVNTATGKRWQLRRRERTPLTHSRLPRWLNGVLATRGITSPEQAEAFLRATLDQEHDPALLPNVEAAVDRICRAIRGNELICAYGDYDVDGVTGAAILVEGLSALGGRVIPYLPDRFKDGYGLNAGALSELHGHGASLVISVDCGISATRAIERANEIGLDVIVLDHHSIPDDLPEAVALVDPKFDDCAYPCTDLAACGLAHKVLGAVAARLGDGRFDPERTLDLVALGTVCDMAPLVGENRSLVRKGLELLKRTSRPGLLALAEAGRFDMRQASAETLGFRVGPRLNAAGRLDHAMLAYELLTTHDDNRARELAGALDRLNIERQQQTKQAIQTAEALLAEARRDSPLIMLGHPEIPQGIVGLVAGRLAEAHHRPAIVYQRGPDESRGSARSIPQLDIVEALRSGQHFMTNVGGHRAAAGFSAYNTNMDALTEFLHDWVGGRLAETDLTPVLEYDDELDLDSFGPAELRWLPYLEPHGQGNPEPLFVARGLAVVESRAVGDGTHLRLRLRSGGAVWPGIAFGLAHAAPPTGGRVDVLFAVRKNDRGGPDLHIRDLERR